MEKICEKISRYLLKENQPNDDEIDEVRFGIELILTQTILFLIILTIGFFSNMIGETLIFMTVLVSLRTFVNGYHADSFYRCIFLTTLFYIMTVMLAKINNIYLLTLAVLFAFKAFYCQSNESKANVRISKIIFICCCTIMIVSYQYNCLLANIVGFTVFFTSVSMEVEKYGSKKQNCYIGEESFK